MGQNDWTQLATAVAVGDPNQNKCGERLGIAHRLHGTLHPCDLMLCEERIKLLTRKCHVPRWVAPPVVKVLAFAGFDICRLWDDFGASGSSPISFEGFVQV